MQIKSKSEFCKIQAKHEAIIQKGTSLGDMELLNENDKAEFIKLSQLISEWEAAYHPLPGRVSTLVKG